MITERLKSMPVFADLDASELAAVAALVSERSVAPGVELLREGDYSYDLLVIDEGTAQVRAADRVLAELGPGEFFGEVGVLRRSPRMATVSATSPMRVVSLSRWDVRRLRRTAPAVVDKLERTIAEREAANRAAPLG